MKVLTAVTVALLLSSTSALAFQERPVQETGAQATQAKTTPLSQFSDDDNDGAIAQAYGPGAFTSTSDSSNSYPVLISHQHK